jgi:hypothetical protein
MKTSEVILQGYKNYHHTYIDQRFIELVTVFHQITAYLADMRCDILSDDAMAQCLTSLENNPLSPADIDHYLRSTRTSLSKIL